LGYAWYNIPPEIYNTIGFYQNLYRIKEKSIRKEQYKKPNDGVLE
jgi:hypothetical protein